jgi:phosphatidylserine decarboxylase
MNQTAAQLFVLLQKITPRSLLTALVFRLARIRVVAIKDFLIRRFITHYKVDTGECLLAIPAGFATFNDFFIRELKADKRPIDADDRTVVSPADGTVSAAGNIEREKIFQAKGLTYSLTDLLATDLDDTEKYSAGAFVTIYLAPYNYHRVHCPLAGHLIAMRYVPGELYSVNTATVSLLPNLFTRNERLVCHFDTADGPMVLVMVGAMNVGSISTPWTGTIRPRRKGVVENIDIAASGQSTTLAKGELLGWFNMGSTVIVLLPNKQTNVFSKLADGDKTLAGAAIGLLS